MHLLRLHLFRSLGLQARITELRPTELMLSAVGQGALRIEAREDDAGTLAMFARLDDPATHATVLAERKLLAALRAGCLAPVGAWARVACDHLELDAVVLSPDGRRISVTRDGLSEQAETPDAEAAADLLGQGAAQLIAASHQPG